MENISIPGIHRNLERAAGLSMIVKLEKNLVCLENSDSLWCYITNTEPSVPDRGSGE